MRPAYWVTCIGLTLVLTLVLTLALRAGQAMESRFATASAPSTSPTPAEDGLVETFVLTPIRQDCTDMRVLAQRYGPTTNNSCQDWNAKSEACYLPSHVLMRKESPQVPGMAALLERHTSALVGAWRPGAWPAAGASITFALEQYGCLEHVWLAVRVDLRESVGGCYLTVEKGRAREVLEASERSPAELEIEVFDDVRNVQGYPRRIQY